MKYQDLIQKYGEERIFYLALGFYPEEKKHFCNPLRDDKSPSAYFSFKGRFIRFHDRGYQNTSMNCIDAYQASRNIRSFSEALKRIEEELEGKPIDVPASTPSLPVKYSHTCAAWTDETLSYWESFYITLPTLKEYSVSPILELDRNHMLYYHWQTNNPGFVYQGDANGYKYYFPWEKKTKKWRQSGTGQQLYGKHTIHRNKINFITSSVKDAMCLYEMGFGAYCSDTEYGVENNNFEKSSKKLHPVIKSLPLTQKVYSLMDNDRQGKESDALMHYLGYKKCSPNLEQDVAYHVSRYGLAQTKLRILHEINQGAEEENNRELEMSGSFNGPPDNGLPF